MLLYFGIDVHTTNYTVAVYQPPMIGMVSTEGVYLNVEKLAPESKNVIALVNQYKKAYGDSLQVILGYEAGCIGASLYRDLTAAKLNCVILAPTTMAVSPVDRTYKDDKRDAKMIARCLSNQSYKSVYVNTPRDEAVANYVRVRDDAQDRVKVLKQQTMAYCHRFGFNYHKSYWTKAHYDWFKKLTFENPVAREVLDAYLLDLQTAIERVEAYDKRIDEFSKEADFSARVAKLGCFLGISTTRALALVAEVGNFDRFASADKFASYLGLVPGRHSSGNDNPRLPITKAGNTHLRKELVEAAQSICKGKIGHKSKELKKRQKGQTEEVIAYADKGNTRFRKRYYKLIHKGKSHNVAVVAIARDLACFIWGMMTNHYSVAGVPDASIA